MSTVQCLSLSFLGLLIFAVCTHPCIADTPPASPMLTLISPTPYQVFQRESRLRGTVRVSGRAPVPADAVQVRISGRSLTGTLPGKWQMFPVNAQTHLFNALVPTIAGGWYAVQAQAMQGKRALGQVTVTMVGVGEVFVIAGQSNSTNSGEGHTITTSGMVASFSGTGWQLGNDPQPGTADNSMGGSPWPAFGDALYERYHVPIGIASTGCGGTTVLWWQPGSPHLLYDFTLNRIRELGYRGFRAVLWHQGESDTAMASADYVKYMTTLIEQTQTGAGWEFPWFVAQVSYHNEGDASSPNTRTAQKQLWDRGEALPGPDTDTLRGDNRIQNAPHFTVKGLHAHGLLWAQSASTYLDTLFAQENNK